MISQLEGLEQCDDHSYAALSPLSSPRQGSLSLGSNSPTNTSGSEGMRSLGDHLHAFINRHSEVFHLYIFHSHVSSMVFEEATFLCGTFYEPGSLKVSSGTII